MIRLAIAASMLVFGALALAEQRAPVVLTIEAPEQAAQGDAIRVNVTLEDPRGQPLAGELVTIGTTVPFFDYRGTFVLGEVRTNFMGRASLPFTPTVEGSRRFTAEFAGTEQFAPATANRNYSVMEGVLPEPAPPFSPVLPWLTRETATLILLPAMLGVWVIFGYALYQITRIARGEANERTVPAKARASG